MLGRDAVAGWQIGDINGSPECAKNLQDFVERYQQKKHIDTNGSGFSKILFVAKREIGKADNIHGLILFAIRHEGKEYLQFYAHFKQRSHIESKPLYSSQEALAFLDSIHGTYPLPLELYQQFQIACGGFPEQALEVILKEKDFTTALKSLENYTWNTIVHDKGLIALGDILFHQYSFEHASHCYTQVTPTDKAIFQRAQYQLGNIVFNQTDSKKYPHPRDHARAAFSYYFNAGDYIDADLLAKKIFNCLCLNHYKLANDIPFPKDVDSILALSDYMYNTMEALIEENKKLKAALKQVDNEKYLKLRPKTPVSPLTISLPIEIILHILSFLPKEREQLKRFALSCRAHLAIAQDSRLFKQFPKFHDYAKISSVQVINKLGSVINAVSSPDGSTLAVSIKPKSEREKGKTVVFSTLDGEISSTFETDSGGYRCLSYSRDGAKLIACDAWNNFEYWDVKSNELQMKLSANVTEYPQCDEVRHISSINEIITSAFGVPYKESVMRFYSMDAANNEKLVCNKKMNAKSVLISQDGNYLYRMIDLPPVVEIYDINGEHLIKSIPVGYNASRLISVDNKNKKLFCKHSSYIPGAYRGQIDSMIVYDLETGAGQILNIGMEFINEVCVTHDGAFVIAMNDEGILYRLNTTTNVLTRIEANVNEPDNRFARKMFLTPKDDKLVLVFSDAIKIAQFARLKLQNEMVLSGELNEERPVMRQG